MKRKLELSLDCSFYKIFDFCGHHSLFFTHFRAFTSSWWVLFVSVIRDLKENKTKGKVVPLFS